MRKLLLAVVVGSFLSSCGNGVHVEAHHVDRQRIEAMSGVVFSLGYAEWNDDTGECDIYIVPRNSVPIETYHETLGHELRHCFEGDWHK